MTLDPKALEKAAVAVVSNLVPDPMLDDVERIARAAITAYLAVTKVTAPEPAKREFVIEAAREMLRQRQENAAMPTAPEPPVSDGWRDGWRDGNRPLPFDRDTLGRLVRQAWVQWANSQPNPKPSWLVRYDELPEPDKEADRQIGETVARWALIGVAATGCFSDHPKQQEPK